MLNPILALSATRRMRSFRTLLIVIAYAAVLMGIALAMMGSFFRPRVLIGGMGAGVTCYATIMAAQFALLVLIAPAMTSGSIAGERERGTLELMLVTNTGSFRIVAGKVMESFAMLALLIVCGLPAVCLCLLSGSVSPAGVLMGEGFLLAVGFGAACVGVFCSSIARSTMTGTILSYLMILLIGALTSLPFLLGYSQRITDIVYDPLAYSDLTPAGALGMISPFLFLNPGYGLTALIQGQTRILADRLNVMGWGRILCTWKLMSRAGCETVTMISAGAIVLAGTALLGAAALLVRPGDRVRKGQKKGKT